MCGGAEWAGSQAAAGCPARGWARQAGERSFAGQEQGSVYSQLQPVGGGRSDGRGEAVDHGRREGLRLCNGQCGLVAQRWSGGAVVAGLEEDCDVPAGPAQGEGDVSRSGYKFASRSAGLEVSVGGG